MSFNLKNSATDKLSLTRTSAAVLDVVVSFTDLNTSTGVVTPDNQKANFNTAATGDICATPGANTVRRAQEILITNKDASLSCDVNVNLDANGTLYVMPKFTLSPGMALEYIEGIGFFTIGPSALLDKVLYVTANSVHATAATFAAITGLSTPVLAGKRYAFQCMLAAITNATTTGAQFGVGGVAMTDMVAAGYSTLLGSPTASATITSGVVTAVDTAVMAQTTGAAVNQPHIFWGSFQPSADGTFSIKATSEVSVAAGLTVLKGSWCWIRQTDN